MTQKPKKLFTKLTNRRPNNKSGKTRFFGLERFWGKISHKYDIFNLAWFNYHHPHLYPRVRYSCTVFLIIHHVPLQELYARILLSQFHNDKWLFGSFVWSNLISTENSLRIMQFLWDNLWSISNNMKVKKKKKNPIQV